MRVYMTNCNKHFCYKKSVMIDCAGERSEDGVQPRLPGVHLKVSRPDPAARYRSELQGG